MKIYLIILILSLFTFGLHAQGVYNNGAKIVVGTGTYLSIGGTNGNYRNETNVSNGSIDLSGILKITGNVTNNVAASDILGTTASTGEVILTGTLHQTLGGTTTAGFQFPNLTINNSAGIIFAKNAQVNGTMTFTSGLIDIGNNNFTFGTTASNAGTPSATSMIIASGTGQVQKNWSAIGSFTFPVGDNNVTAKYSPVTLNFTSGTFAAGALAGVNLVNARYNNPSIAVSYLNRYWNITQTGITGFVSDAVFQYVASDVVGTETSISSLRVSPTPITAFNSANVTLHQLSATGLTSFGTFTGGIGSKILNLKLYIEGLYAGGSLMNQAQGLAGNQFTGSTSDKITVELHDPVTYLTTITSIGNIDLSTTGLATVNIPVSYSGSYYVTVKHRNSNATVTSSTLLFSSPTISYDFTTSAAQAFGSNQKTPSVGVNVIYSGDVNQDGIIDLGDLVPVGNQSAIAASGYIPEDVNGDGLVDLSDLIIVGNNAATAIGTITP